ncbi:MAG: DUF3347 domain-containing protein [Flavobacteriales bacterium]|nr:DUF3347 domain-containing protein [Flavobacteriales bacterium]MCB9178303.1 DUF3347 domain-containing protein [Flavobacteriales bacterium]HPF91350.1 DUF3347 domain-containing protein [Flavobacteriales bacterium]
MRTILLTHGLAALLAFNSCTAQAPTTAGIKNVSTLTLRVDGDCPMCEKTIEAAAFRKGEAHADWDVDAKTAVITIDSTRTTVDAVLRRIAEAGYDNERYLAPDKAYAGLPGCCQYERGMKHEPVKGDVHHDHANAHHAEAQPSVFDKEGYRGTPQRDEPVEQQPMDPVREKSALEALFAHYFELKDALVAGNGDAAKQVAATMGEVLHRMDPTKLTAAQQATWEQLITEAMPLLHPLSETTDLATQRKLFAQLTAPILQLAETTGEGTIYLAHCPMYEGGADWLTRDKAIKNPFYGSMMLTCGSVTRTITK